MDSRQSVISRIRKLLNLSKSANSNEGATALRLAKSLTKRHGITAEELDDSELQVTGEMHVNPKWADHWRIMLMMFVCRPLNVTLSRRINCIIIKGALGRVRDTHHVYDHYEKAIIAKLFYLADGRITTAAESQKQADLARGMAVAIGRAWKERCAGKAPTDDGFRLTWTPANAPVLVSTESIETIQIPATVFKNAYRTGLQLGASVPFPPERKRHTVTRK